MLKMETNLEIREDEFQKLASSGKSYLHQRDIDSQQKFRLIKFNHFYDSIPPSLRTELNRAQTSSSICYTNFMQGIDGVRTYEKAVIRFEKALKKALNSLAEKSGESYLSSEIEDLKKALVKLPRKTFESLFQLVLVERESSA